MWRVFGGAALIVAGIAAFIEAHSHRPVAGRAAPTTEGALAFEAREARQGIELGFIGHHGLSNTAYDLLRIGAWALVIFGAVLLLVGLIAYARREAV
jgi:hypothetical protein